MRIAAAVALLVVSNLAAGQQVLEFRDDLRFSSTEVDRTAARELAWEIHTCARCDENAMAMPGGKLLVSADFVARLALTDDELAYLLAHEMAHVLAEHTREFATAARSAPLP